MRAGKRTDSAAREFSANTGEQVVGGQNEGRQWRVEAGGRKATGKRTAAVRQLARNGGRKWSTVGARKTWEDDRPGRFVTTCKARS